MTKIKVAHQGIKGAYSYEAAVTYFANEKDIEIVPKKEFADVDIPEIMKVLSRPKK